MASIKSIKISGSTGFVGQNLSTYLEQNNYSVSSIDLRDKNWNQKVFDNVDAFIHLAGKAHDLKNISDPESYFIVNRDLTISLYKEFLKSSCRLFIFFSSVKAAVDSIDSPLTEDINPNPKTAYGRSKQEAESFILNHLPTHSDQRVIILRPCMIHGPGNKGNLNLLYQFVNKGVPYPLAAYHNHRSFLNIDNLHFIINEILSKNSLPNGIYNIADDDSISTNELIKIIAQSLNRTPRLINVPKSIIQLFAKIGNVLKLPLNEERLQKLTENFVVKNDKLKDHLNIPKLPISIQEGLLKTLSSFKK